MKHWYNKSNYWRSKAENDREGIKELLEEKKGKLGDEEDERSDEDEIIKCDVGNGWAKISIDGRKSALQIHH